MTEVPRSRVKLVNDGYRCELCGAGTEYHDLGKASPDGIAETEADHFVKCPGCGQSVR
jgi:DNA-directed RNA polymerase subunit RPC12/RpoP